MATAIRPIGHEDRLSLVEHLDELRTRLMICVATLVVAFSVCAWQNGVLLDFIGKPLANETKQRTQDGKGPLGGIYVAQRAARAALQREVTVFSAFAHDRSLPASMRDLMVVQAAQARRDLRALPAGTPTNRPVTLGIGEPFTQTISVAFYFALLFSLPILLYQLYAFVLPAFNATERRVAMPLMAMIPFLFAAGVAFAYVVVLPAATRFLQNFNADDFNVLVQARDYYKFAVLTLVSIGLVFQLPVAILAVTRIGLLTVSQLRQYRRYAIVGNAVLAMVLPGTDPVSMLLEFAILHALYELSVVLAAILGRRAEADDETLDLEEL
jgi:sec-independent protein translocase protein TatC